MAFKSLLIIILITSLNSYSQDSTFWMELMQPEIGQVNKIFIDKNNNLYICTENGLFKSINRSKAWRRTCLFSFRSIVIDSSNNFYAQYLDNNWEMKFIYSTDSGESWMDRKISGDEVYSFNIIGFDSLDILYALGTETKKSLILYYSTDYGYSWRKNVFKHNLPGDYINYFRSIDMEGNIYSCGIIDNSQSKQKGILFKSSDRGITWDSIIVFPSVFSIYNIDSNTFLLGTSQGLYLTSDNGKNWITTLDSLEITSIERLSQTKFFISCNSNEVAYNVYSSDFCKTWEFLSLNESYYKSCIRMDKLNNKLYGGNELGFFISTDSGHKWTRSNKGFSAADIVEMAEDSYRNIYAVGHPGGVYKSIDNGTTWLNIGLESHSLSNIAINKNDEIFVSIFPYNSDTAVIYRSTNFGETWEDKSKGLVWQSGISVLVKDIFITNRGNILLGSPFDEYWISTDNGESWIEKNVEGRSLCFAYNSEGHLFRGGYDGIFYRSTDEGQTWEKMKKAGNYHSYEFYSMVFSPYSQVGFASGGSMIWSTTEPTCLKTIDNGRSWFRTGYCGPVVVDSLNNFWRSYYKSSNSGESWESVTDGISNEIFNSNFVDSKGYIYLMAHNGGLYRSRDRYVSVPEAPEPPGGVDGLSARPNPASDYIEISGISPPAKSWAEDRIRIYNALGEIILTAGAIHELPLRIDVSSLPPGLYFVRLGDQAYKFLKISPSGGG